MFDTNWSVLSCSLLGSAMARSFTGEHLHHSKYSHVTFCTTFLHQRVFGVRAGGPLQGIQRILTSRMFLQNRPAILTSPFQGTRLIRVTVNRGQQSWYDADNAGGNKDGYSAGVTFSPGSCHFLRFLHPERMFASVRSKVPAICNLGYKNSFATCWRVVAGGDEVEPARWIDYGG